MRYKPSDCIPLQYPSVPFFIFIVFIELVLIYPGVFLNMVYFSKLAAAFITASVCGAALAHPGEHHDHVAAKREVVMRNHYATQYRRALDNCENTADARALKQRASERRAATASKLRAERGLSKSNFIHDQYFPQRCGLTFCRTNASSP